MAKENKIKECVCPNCGETIRDYWENCDEQDFADDDVYFFSYYIHCNCGRKFRYIEYYQLSEAEIEEI